MTSLMRFPGQIISLIQLVEVFQFIRDRFLNSGSLRFLLDHGCVSLFYSKLYRSFKFNSDSSN